MKYSKQWFIDRIDKRIYRLNDNKCPCKICKIVLEEGLIIFNLQHASYLYDCQNELGSVYSDKKEA